MEQRRFLVTGAAGALGHAVVERLRDDGHFVRGFDLNPAPSGGDCHTGNLLDFPTLRAAAADVDTLVHLAGVPDRDSFVEELVPNNIIGTHSAFEAARVCGIKRVIYASSCRVVGGLDWNSGCIGLDAGMVPGDHYGLTKATGELMAKMYADRFGISMLCVRLGWFVRNLEEANRVEEVGCGTRIYVSHRDATNFFSMAAVAEPTPFATVFLVSKNFGSPAFDPEPARELLGFEPSDSWPNGSAWSEQLHFPSPRYAPSLMPEG